ncbi:MAG: hypothetical protein ACUVXA_19115 [Candidatus Jordarchaeum sp.]|uniref:hypothetical protein n=1 Tax=Candidatus Jordarchaeum sp. TaxID=2823881 RepID=UPI00404A9309
MSLVLILILYSYRYFVYPIPQGWDTAWYLESLRSINMDFFGAFSSLDSILGFPVKTRPLYFLLLYSVNLVIGCEEVTLMVIPIIFAILYAFATYEFVLVGTNDKLVAGLAMVLAPLSYFTVRMSFDLYNNFLGLIIALLFLTVLMKAMKNVNKRNLLLGCILFFALLLIHVWTWMIFLAILASFVFIQVLRRRKNFQKNLYTITIVTLPSVIMGLIIISMRPTIIHLSWFNFFSFPAANWYWVSMKTSPFLLIPAIYGLYVVFTKNTHFTNLIIVWVVVLSLLVFVTGNVDSYRFYILYPVGILAAFGAYDIIGRADVFLHKGFMWKRRGVLLYVFVPVLFCLLVFSSTLPESFDWVYLNRPNGLAMMQVYWIYWVYGYNNRNIIVLFNDPPAKPLRYSWTSNIEFFSRAYIGFDSMYFGNLTSLLKGRPDSFGRTFDISNKTIILASELYLLTPLELSMTKEVSWLGIYFVI